MKNKRNSESQGSQKSGHQLTRKLSMDDVISVVQDFGYSVIRQNQCHVAAQKGCVPFVLIDDEDGVRCRVQVDIPNVLASNPSQIQDYAAALNNNLAATKVYVIDGSLRYEQRIPWCGGKHGVRDILMSFFSDVSFMHGGTPDEFVADMIADETRMANAMKSLEKPTRKMMKALEQEAALLTKKALMDLRTGKWIVSNCYNREGYPLFVGQVVPRILRKEQWVAIRKAEADRRHFRVFSNEAGVRLWLIHSGVTNVPDGGMGEITPQAGP